MRRAYEPLMLWGHFDRGAGRVTVHLISDLMNPIAGECRICSAELLIYSSETCCVCQDLRLADVGFLCCCVQNSVIRWR